MVYYIQGIILHQQPSIFFVRESYLITKPAPYETRERRQESENGSKDVHEAA